MTDHNIIAKTAGTDMSGDAAMAWAAHELGKALVSAEVALGYDAFQAAQAAAVESAERVNGVLTTAGMRQAAESLRTAARS